MRPALSRLAFGLFASIYFFLPPSLSSADNSPLPIATQVGSTIQLDPTSGLDLSDPQLSRFEWEWVSRPATSVAQFSSTTDIRPNVTIDLPGTYVAQVSLFAADDLNSVTPLATSTLNISTEGLVPVPVVQGRGVPGDIALTLDGSASYDLDGDALTYSWSVVSAPAESEVSFGSPDSVLTDVDFTGAGDFVLGLSVQDVTGLTSDVATYEVRTTATSTFDGDFDLQGSLSTFNLLTETFSGHQEVEGRTYIGSTVQNTNGQFGYDPAIDGLDLAELYIDGDLQNSNINLTPGDEARISGVAQNANVNNGVLVPQATDLPAIDFQAYRDQSAFLASLTGDTANLSDQNHKQFGGAPNAIAAEATFGPNTRIVEASLQDLQSGGYSVDLSQADTVIVNVSGQSGSFQMNPLGGTGAAENVIWNFYEATQINVNSVIMGHVLAPYAVMSGFSGSSEGTVIAKEVRLTNGELHQRDWDGVVPVASGSGSGSAEPGEVTSRLVAPMATSTFSHLETGVNEVLLLEAFSSTDIDGDVLTRDVTVVAQPDGASPTLTVDANSLTSFSSDVEGDYLISFGVDDGVFVDSEAILITVGSNNQAPQARIEYIASAVAGASLALDGTQSFDLDGDLLSYEWSLLSAPATSAASLSASGPISEFTPDLAGTYVVQLSVADETLVGTPATLLLIVENEVPLANAGRDILTSDETLAPLDASASVGSPTAYFWTSTGLTGVPGTFDDASSLAPLFTLPSASGEMRDVIETKVVYEINRADLNGLCKFDSRLPTDIANPAQAWWHGVSFWANGQVNGRPVWVANNHIEHTREIKLVGTDGTDYGTYIIPGKTRAYISTNALLNGTQMRVFLDGNQINQAGPQTWTFNRTEQVCGAGGSDVVQLIVDNGSYVSLPDTAFIGDTFIRPVLTTPSPIELDQAAVANLTAPAQAFDANGDALSFEWSLIHRPDLSAATIDVDPSVTKVTGSDLSFIPDVTGLYLIQLEASDGSFAAEPVVFVIASDNAVPVAIIDAPSETFVGDTITLSGSSSFDPNGEAITFDWRILSAPDGSVAAIAEPSVVTVPFTPDVKGQYVFQLIVSDSSASSAPATAILAVPNRAPVAVLDGPIAVSAGDVATFDATGSDDPDNDDLTYSVVVASGPSTDVVILETTDGRFEISAQIAGEYVLELTVDDGEAQTSTTSEVSVIAGNNPPVLADLQSPYSVEAGLELEIALIGSDPDGDTLTYFANPIPFPAGMELDVVTGALSFTPEAGQEGVYLLTVGVSDGILTDEADITIEVTTPTAGETAVAGRVLDALDYANGIETPLGGMPVRLGEDGQATVTGSDGSFGFTDLAAGADLVLVEPNATGGPGGYLATQRPIRVTENQNRSINPDLLLVPLNEGCAVVTAGADTVLSGLSTGVQVTIPADTIFDAAGDLYTGEVCLASLPQQTTVPGFPEDTLACQVFGVSAAGASFTSGLQLSAPNFDNLPETTELALWQQNSNSGNFGRSAIASVDAGAATVSGTMAPIEGGTLFTFLPQSPRIVASADQPTGMHTLNMFEGDLNEMYTLPGYRAFNQAQQISLSYHSSSANPTVIVAGDVTIAPTASLPVTLSSRIEVGGLSIDDSIEWTPRQGLDGSTPALVGEEVVLRQSTPVDASELPSARYDYQFVAQAQYDCSTVEASFGAEFYVQNQSDSPYGTGWSIDDLQTLVQNPDGSVAIIDDDTVTTFDPEPTLSEFNGNPSILPAVGPQGIVTGDFDGNGQMEIAWADSGTGTIQIAEYSGDGDLQITRVIDIAEPNEVLETGYTPNLRDIALGDLTNDAQDDFAYSLFLGQEAGYVDDAGSLFPNLIVLNESLQYFGSFVEIADFNSDGYDDLAIGQAAALRFGSSQSVIDWAAGGPGGLGDFRRIKNDTFLTREVAFQSTTGDVDGDGQDDLIVRNPRGFEIFQFDGNSGSEVFGRRLDRSIWNFDLGDYLTVGDYNSDGLYDVVLSSDTTVFVLFNTTSHDGAVSFAPAVEIVRPANLIGAPYLSSADANGDGIDDLVMSRSDDLYVYLSNGDGTFQPFLTSPLGHDFEFLEVADINGDGSLDIVSSQRFSITVDYSNPSDEGTFIAGAGEFSTLTKLADGTWERRYKDGMVVSYDIDGRQTATTDTYGNSTTYAYDTDGRLASKTDQVGGETVFVYGDAGRLASITYPDGRVTEFEYDDIGMLSEVTEPIGSTVSFTYNDNGQLVSSTNQNGNTASYDYTETGDFMGSEFPDGSSISNQVANSLGLVDGLGNIPPNPLIYVAPEDRVTTVTDRKGELTEIEVNQFGATVRVTDPLDRTTNIIRDENNLVRQVERPSATGGRRTDAMDYDLLGNVTEMVEAVGTGEERTTLYEYESTFSKVVSMTDPDGFTATYIYDGFGQPSSMTDPEGGIMGYTYSAEGQMLSQTDENGNETTYAYDAQLNMSGMTYADGSVTELVYDATGNNTVQMDAVGTPEERHQVRTFDALNRVLTVEITGADGIQIEGITSYAYEPNGNLASVTDETDLVTSMSYDSLERLVAMDDPAEGLIQRAYNEAGEVISHTNGDGETHLYRYDDVSRMTETIDAGGFTKSFDYDDLDNVTMVTDGRGGATGFTYDTLNRMIDRTNPLGLTMSRDYDLRDNLTMLTREDGLIETATYDGLGRRTQVITPDNTLIYGFDPRSNLTEAADNDSRVTFTYDERNRLETTTTDGTVGPQLGVTLTYTYDALDRRTSMSDSLGGQTLYAYDSEDRLTDLTAPWGTVYEFGYDDVGRRTSLLSSTGRASTYSYENGLLATLNHVQSGLTLTDLIYGYDVDGQLTSITDNLNPSASWAISYDSLNRLIQVAEGAAGDIPTPVEDYAYDEEGNRSASHLSAFYSSNAYNQLFEDDTYTYTYDDRGNRVTRTDKVSGAVEFYSYDSQNRLVGYASDVTTATYAYDALDRRIAKTVDEVETSYVYDMSAADWLAHDDITLEFTDTFLTRRWVHSNAVDEPVGFEEYVNTSGVGSGLERTMFADRQGSVLWVADPATGDVLAGYEYDAYGQITQIAGTLVQPYGYTGREYDPESGLYYYRARNYDPANGVFVQRDPIGFASGSYNIYNFVENNPFTYSDPTGLSVAIDNRNLTLGVSAVTGRALWNAGLFGSITALAVSIEAQLSKITPGVWPFPLSEAGVVAASPNGRDPCAGKRAQLNDHLRKFDEHVDNPYLSDNKGLLTGNVLLDMFHIMNRRSSLRIQVMNWTNQVRKCERENGMR